jgi:hypothetical protein
LGERVGEKKAKPRTGSKIQSRRRKSKVNAPELLEAVIGADEPSKKETKD